MDQVGLALAYVGASMALTRALPLLAKHNKPKVNNKIETLQKPKFLTQEIATRISNEFGTPIYVYDEKSLKQQAQNALNFPSPFSLKVRYAMKACPNSNILRMFHSMGLNFDASSGYEVTRALKAGIPATSISLSAQELPVNFRELMSQGVHFNACSLLQLETFGKLFRSDEGRLSGPAQCGIRFNPGVGSGGTGKTNVGGPSASFGIWHAYLEDVKRVASQYGIDIIRIHTHIGSGSDPKVWQSATYLSLALVKEFPKVHTLNLGGGFKVARVDHLEKATILEAVGAPVKELLQQFYEESKRKINLEIEPGTYLLANAGCLLATVQDIIDTSKRAVASVSDERGYRFLKLNSGMTELLRPSMYGAQHPILLLDDDKVANDGRNDAKHQYIVVGHCCESGDLFSCELNEPEVLREVGFSREMRVGDLISLEGSGAYCSSMSTKNYNSFPEAPEVLLRADGTVASLRIKQTMDQIVQNETNISF